MTTNEAGKIRVWDPVVRIFHWSLVLSFLVAWVTEDEVMAPHVWAGYLITALLLIRIAWGFIGTAHARFRDFLYSPAVIRDYMRKMLSRSEPRYLGHNPAGGVMVTLLILSLLITVFSGIALYGNTDLAGPMAGLFQGEMSADIFEEVHEFFANFTLFLVILHVGGVVWSSFAHRENLARSMVTGVKEIKPS
ncbi:MAG: cytochrome b/b6 domain-containing protein [Sedimenticolaceae bacterium]|nr:cytochrome b/b6 domain-containing protein [Sedimenticolaceae bacterium]